MRYKIKSLFRNPFLYTTLTLVALLLLQVTDIVRAQTYQWTSPNAAFPGGNTAPPLDVSNINQTKDGSITFGSGSEKIIVSSSSISIRPGDNIMRKIEKTVHGIQLGAGTTNPSYIRINEPTGKISADSANPFIFNTKGLVLPATSTFPIDDGRASLYFNSGTNSVNVVTSNGASRAFVTSDQIMASAWQTAGSGIYYGGGNVGIGTNNPKVKLDIHGNVRINGDVTRPDLFPNSNETVSHITWPGHFLVLNNESVYSHARVAIVPATSTSGLTNGALQIFSATSTGASSTYTENVFITSAGYSYFNGGNVGIGTTTPNAKLQIRQTENGAPALQIDSGWPFGMYNLTLTPFSAISGIVGYSFGTKNNNVQFDNNLVLDRGKVGIGTNSPDERFSVVGNVHINSGDLRFESFQLPDLSEVDGIGCNQVSGSLNLGTNINVFVAYSFGNTLGAEGSAIIHSNYCGSSQGNSVNSVTVNIPSSDNPSVDFVNIYLATTTGNTNTPPLSSFFFAKKVGIGQPTIDIINRNDFNFTRFPRESNVSTGNIRVSSPGQRQISVIRLVNDNSIAKVGINLGENVYPKANLDISGGVRWNGKISMPNMGVGSHQPESPLMVKYDSSSSGNEGYYAVYAP